MTLAGWQPFLVTWMKNECCWKFLEKSIFITIGAAVIYLVVKVSDGGWPCHKFELNTPKDSSCRRSDARYICRELKRPPGVVALQLEEGGTAQVSSTSLDIGSKLRGPLSKALM
ncbi:hypothetical protein TNCV_1282171 [Trichonephila clavipes]|uniref:Uncharacterized protein n=1 Tax=Trichonephila clavipes TaxID=2585209 RepID=A0A8X6SKT9_TRICX|nr:hypothetical protein TNCV_1282171 [Trichonephila clavipes]